MDMVCLGMWMRRGMILEAAALTARRPSGLNEHASSDAFVGMTKAICVSADAADVTLTAKM